MCSICFAASRLDHFAARSALDWLLGLQVPFESRNVQELCSKVCRGRFAPISARFSPELAKVVYCLLMLDPAQRISVEQVWDL
jgi:hypothetical protein